MWRLIKGRLIRLCTRIPSRDSLLQFVTANSELAVRKGFTVRNKAKPGVSEEGAEPRIPQLYTFVARVPVLGYEVIQDDKAGSDLLTIRGGGLSGAVYESTTLEIFNECPTLYLEFADTPLTTDGVVAFADRYGRLSDGWDFRDAIVFRSRYQEEHLESLPCFHEFDVITEPEFRYSIEAMPVGAWHQEIQLFRLAIELWRGIKTRDNAGLKRFMELRNQKLYLSLPFDPVTPHSLLDGLSESYEWQDLFQLVVDDEPGYPFEIEVLDRGLRRDASLVSLASELLRVLVNRNLQESHPRLGLKGDGQLEILFVPNDLLSALWLQFSLAIQGLKEYKVCPSCGEWFGIGKYGARRDRKYCDDTCKQRAFEKRKGKGRAH